MKFLICSNALVIDTRCMGLLNPADIDPSLLSYIMTVKVTDELTSSKPDVLADGPERPGNYENGNEVSAIISAAEI